MKPNKSKSKNRPKARKPRSLSVAGGSALSWVEWRDILHGLENGEGMWKMHAERYRSDPAYSEPNAGIHPVHANIIEQYRKALITVKRIEPLPNGPVSNAAGETPRQP